MSEFNPQHGTAIETSWSPAGMIDRLGGDEELARQLVELFVSECPRMMSAIRDSVANADADKIRRAAHAFKGSVGNFTDEAPMTTAFALERLGTAGNVAEATALLPQLEREVEQFVSALRRFEAGQP
jgi:two-component system, sensor histidine kinase and response regulator